MKRKILTILALILCLSLMLSFVACSGDEEESSSSSSDGDGEGEVFIVSFDPNYEGAEEIADREVKAGKKIGTLPEIKRDGWIFEGWYLDDVKYTSAKKVTEDITLVAKWSEEPPCDHAIGFENAYLTEADCENPSILTQICLNPRCRFVVETELAPALGHDMRTREPVPANCIEAGYTKKECVRPGCPYEERTPGDPPTGIHAFPETWQTIRAETDYAFGQYRHGCKVCGELEYKEVEPKKYAEFNDLPIENVVVGGKNYVNVAETSSVLCSSLYRTTIGANAVDGSPATFWRADTLTSRESFTGDTLLLTLATTYEVAKLEFTIPNYWAWKLGEEFTVEFKIELFDTDAKAWVEIGTISDSDNMDPVSKNAVVDLNLPKVYNTNKIKMTVTHATRYSPAMVYEIKVFGLVEDFYRAPQSIAPLATGQITGSYNSWVNSSAANLLDGSTNTSWCTDARVWFTAETQIYGTSSNSITNGAVHYGRTNKQSVSKVVVTADKLVGETIDVRICRAWSEQIFVNKQVQSTDEQGNPLFDEDGNPIMENVKDEEGNIVQVPKMKEKVDAEGNVVLDGNGNPIMEEVWEDRTQWVSCGIITVAEGDSGTYTFTPKTKNEKGEEVETTLTDVVLVRVDVDNYGADENKDDHTITSMTITTGSGDTTYQRNELEWTYRKKVYATLSFPQPEYIAYIDIVCAKDVGRIMSLQFWVEDAGLERGGYWKEYSKMEIFENSATGGIATFTVDVGEYQTKMRLEITREPAVYGAYIYDITPFTVAEIAKELPKSTECLHKLTSADETTIVTVAPTCTTAGYTTYKCFSCDATWRTDAVDMTGHLWDQGTVGTIDRNKVIEYSCTVDNCDAKKTVVTAYRTADDSNPFLNVPTVTKYFHNAPGAWSMTFDDGNYIDTYEWVVPELAKRNFKATAVITVQYSGSYTYEWEKYLASGTFDIGSHSQFHAGSFSDEKADESMLMKEIDNAHYIFASWFPGQRLLGFATPNGATGAGTADFVTDLMIGGRSGGQAGVFVNPDNLTTRLDWGNLPCYVTFRSLTFDTDPTKADVGNNNGRGNLATAIEKVANEGLWSIDCIHTIDTSEKQNIEDKFSIKKDTMIKKLDYMAEKGLWVGSYTQALQYLKEAKVASIEDMVIGTDSISFGVTDGLDDCMFVQPLTFQFKLPSGWTNVKVTQNGVDIPMYDSKDYSPNMDVDMACTIIDGVLYFDAVPDAGTVVITKQ